MFASPVPPPEVGPIGPQPFAYGFDRTTMHAWRRHGQEPPVYSTDVFAPTDAADTDAALARFDDGDVGELANFTVADLRAVEIASAVAKTTARTSSTPTDEAWEGVHEPTRMRVHTCLRKQKKRSPLVPGLTLMGGHFKG